MKILLVDDDQSLATIITTALEKEGYAATASYTGRGGLDRAKSELPNLILLDQVLPDISGNQVLKELKIDEQTKNIPVLMLSNFGQTEMVNQAINEGAADYIFKYQVEVSDIIGKVRDALKPSAPIAS
ncbi:MAG: response regulator [Patescibacteria group bacterium]